VRVRGLVEMPQGIPCWDARVLVEGEGVASFDPRWMRGSQFPDGHRVDNDGRFELYVSVTRPVTLRAWHSYLSPDPKRGSLAVRGEVDDVRLALVPGDEVQIPLAPIADNQDRRQLRIYAYRGNPVGEPDAWFCAPVVEGVARFSGLAPGTWTLWVDPDGHLAPMVMRDVHVGPGITRVELVRSTGSLLRVHVLHAPGKEAPQIYAVAEHKSEPMLMRQINSQREDLVLVPGLSAGAYEVSVSAMQDNGGDLGRRLERTIEFDGTHDVDIDFDVRSPK
jgi:hypothetical protein